MQEIVLSQRALVCFGMQRLLEGVVACRGEAHDAIADIQRQLTVITVMRVLELLTATRIACEQICFSHAAGMGVHLSNHTLTHK